MNAPLPSTNPSPSPPRGSLLEKTGSVPRSTRNRSTVLLLAGCALLLVGAAAAAYAGQGQGAGTSAPRWQRLAPGLSYREVVPPAGSVRSSFTLHAFRIELGHFRPVVADARRPEGARATATVRELARERQASLVVNGSFFDERRRPLGLLVEQGREISPLRRADWGVLYIVGGQARLVHTRQFREAALRREAIEFAIQVGPRVVALGRPLPLKPQRAERSAIGILPDGALVVVASQGGVVESNDLAQVMAAPPTEDGLGCRDALMMDGGPSAQLYAAAGDFQLDLPGLYGVPIAVGFVKR